MKILDNRVILCTVLALVKTLNYIVIYRFGKILFGEL